MVHISVCVDVVCLTTITQRGQSKDQQGSKLATCYLKQLQILASWAPKSLWTVTAATK